MEAECSDDVMKLRVKFNATFNGLVYSAGELKIKKIVGNNISISIICIIIRIYIVQVIHLLPRFASIANTQSKQISL